MKIAELSYLQRKVLDIKNGAIPQGLKLDLPEIDEYLRLKRGNFNICVGHANTGKTTVILHLMMAYALKHGFKWLIFSSENTEYSIATKLLEAKMGMSIHKMDEYTLAMETEKLMESFRLVLVDKIFTARDLLREAAEYKNEWDYDGIMIDPYNSLAKDPQLLRSVGGHEYDYQIASEMRLFCKEKNVTMWLNAHAVTEALRRKYDKDHEFAGHPMHCGAPDIEGGGKWVNRADDVISVHRLTQHENLWNISYIHVLKIKETETGGRPTSVDSPIPLRMEMGNTSFTCAGKSLINSAKYREEAKLNYKTKLF